MVGAEAGPPPPSPLPVGGEGLALRVEPRGLPPLELSVRPGEILGLASGRSAVLRALFGLNGSALVGGWTVRGPQEAIRRGLFLVPGDRKTQGLILSLSAQANLALPLLPRLAPLGWVREGEERALARRWLQALGVRPASPRLPASAFSGGNQQKLVLAKALATSPRLLLLEEPTRGVDVGARQEIYALLRAWAEQGLAQIVSSGDTEELLALCHRILVFRNGRPVVEFQPPYRREEVVAHVTGAALV